jgi:hypothetical protein
MGGKLMFDRVMYGGRRMADGEAIEGWGNNGVGVWREEVG